MKKYTIITIALVLAVLVSVGTVKANPSYFPPPAATATATTTAAYIATPGTATSTITYDSYYVNTLGNYTKTDSAAVLIQYQSSTTNTTLGWQYEYSQDGSDWYGDSFDYSTTTMGNGLRDSSVYNSSVWRFASTTVGSSQSGSINKLVQVPTPTRYTRIKFYSVVGAVSVWAQFVPAKQKAE